MNNNSNCTIKDECDPVIKIVLAGTIASGKTTLLGALSAYEEGQGDDQVHVNMYIPDGVNLTREDYKRCLDFRIDAVNCFNNTSASPCLGYDPWPGATNPNVVPKKIWLEIAAHGDTHKLSFLDFAGETFLDAFDVFYNDQQGLGTEQERTRLFEQAKANVKHVVGTQFNAAIADAHIVLIVVSCKDIVDFQSLLQRDRDYAERMQFAYSFMMARTEELQRPHKDRRVFLVITQCDQYKALLSSNMELVENGLKGLLADASCSQIERIYTSSAYQTELKAIKIGDAKSPNLKFCPTSKDLRRNDQPSSLGIKTLVERICNVSERAAAERIETLKRKLEALKKELGTLKKESDVLKKKLADLEESAKCAIAEAQKIIKVMEKEEKKFWSPLNELYKERDSVADALKELEEKIQACSNNEENQDCSNKEIIQDCSDDINGIRAAINGMEAAISGVRTLISGMRGALKVGEADINKRIRDLNKRIEVERKKVRI